MIPSERRSPGLLVSVRSALEAEAALVGGADIIDVKEPALGSLGRASDQTIIEVLDRVPGPFPVSAAMGELVDAHFGFRDPRLTFVKWGLANYGRLRTETWQSRLEREISLTGNPQTVIVAYADWQCAQAPPIDAVVAFACQKPGNVLLIDTHCKETGTLKKDSRPTLLDWLSREEIGALCAQCRTAQVRVALAGSLGITEILQLRSANPDWFAVRGAVCEENNRQGTIDAKKVRRLAGIF